MLFAQCWVPDAPCLSETSSLELQHFTFLIKNLLLPPEEETTKAVFDFAQADTRHPTPVIGHPAPGISPPIRRSSRLVLFNLIEQIHRIIGNYQ